MSERRQTWHYGLVARWEEHVFQTTLYFRNELRLMPFPVGFPKLVERADYSDAPATAQDTPVAFVARRAGLTPASAVPPDVAAPQAEREP